MPSSVEFLDPRNSLAEGIVAVGGVLDLPTLLEAYGRGIFPWPHAELPMLWFCPERRGVIFVDELKISESLRRFRRKNSHLEITLNKDFDQVMRECARQPRPGQEGTWINEEILQAYRALFKAGYAMSVEVRESGELIGGVYGVLVKGVFSGESMFYKKPNASKLALWYLVEYLSEHGHKWLDVQMVTPVVESMGGRYVDRDTYLQMLGQRQRE